jgi:formate dehydrogenase subunit delta
MNIDLLIKMSNEITAFFVGEHDEEAASTAVANHLRRYWDPRMRKQIIAYYQERQGAGLVDIAKNAVAQLAAQSKAADAPPPPAPLAKSEFKKTPDAADPYGGDAG